MTQIVSFVSIHLLYIGFYQGLQKNMQLFRIGASVLAVQYRGYLKLNFFSSSDSGSHRAGSRPATKNRAEPFRTIASSGRPRWRPEPSPVPHHRADAPVTFPRHCAASERHHADCLHHNNPTTPQPLQRSLSIVLYALSIKNCFSRNNYNTLFIFSVHHLLFQPQVSHWEKPSNWLSSIKSSDMLASIFTYFHLKEIDLFCTYKSSCKMFRPSGKHWSLKKGVGLQLLVEVTYLPYMSVSVSCNGNVPIGYSENPKISYLYRYVFDRIERSANATDITWTAAHDTIEERNFETSK